ncbi:MAG TPA: hypothetical protein VER08_02425, partial [Pyrinomonadaceae bacterium]|nr:hypothetical protein [Pyrinomonadaceae bacterium]
RRPRPRLFWFHTAAAVPPTLNLRTLGPAVEALLASDEPSALHDAALLAHASLLALDPELKHVPLWERALALWNDAAARDPFWSLLVGADLKGDFEQLATHGEVRELRGEVMRLVTAPLADAAREAVAREDANASRTALALLRGAGLAPELLAEYENEILSPFEERFEFLCEEAFIWCSMMDAARAWDGMERACDSTLLKFNENIKPALLDFLRLAGSRGPLSRRVFSKAATGLGHLAEAYRLSGEPESALRTARKARALAPPDSAALVGVGRVLRTLGEDEPADERTEDEYHERLSRELRPRPELFAAYARLTTYADRGPGGFVRELRNLLPVGLLAVSSIAFGFCVASTSRRSGVTLPPPTYLERNYNFRIDTLRPSNENLNRIREELERIQENLNRLQRKSRPAPTPANRRRSAREQKPSETRTNR